VNIHSNFHKLKLESKLKSKAYLGKIKHVGWEQGFAVQLVVLLIGREHAVKPGEQLLGAVVGMKNDGDSVSGGNFAHEFGTGNGAEDGGLLVSVGQSFASHKGRTALAVFYEHVQQIWKSRWKFAGFLKKMNFEVSTNTWEAKRDCTRTESW
jgi:hypothetical protein